jgi:hypothetical protein
MAAAAMPVAAAVPSAAAAMAVSCRGKIGREGDERQRERRYENRHELFHLERPLELGRSVRSATRLSIGLTQARRYGRFDLADCAPD